ncbi:DUF3833 domain-containing protein [Desulfogranum japonicum]|uniref:DUF3833 domain-containing protein n=1 Tax=Desulfogranum japonicum TaxID=231447 RepID=UPI00041A1168|nr:DUF3833 domain-containing protein [Desulfogranum japonicum]
MKTTFILPFILLLLTGCSEINMEAYQENKPRFELMEYFSGHTKGWGIVQDRKGVLLRSFIVDIEGEISQGGQLVLHEEFNWSDGEQSARTWILSKKDDHKYVGTAADVIGEADGVLFGNVLNWQYQLDLKVKESNWQITFDDWMFMVADETVINRATMSKFGFRVGEVTIVFQK